jgi:G patch domain-containing protein 1
VGSKEGWTPATFKSSRQDRAKDSKIAAQQRPEDFMDEEDIREAEESKEMSTAAEYAGLGSTDEDPKRRETFMDIFRPSGETIGVKLLKKMGWKEGQGIGPKVRRKANVAEVEENDSETTTTHLFAPEDPPMISFNRKFDHKGLGFESEARLQNEGTKFSTSIPSRNDEDNSDEDRKNAVVFGRNTPGGREGHKIKKGSFGVGILNDTGSDEDDPYQMGPKISYNRVIGGSKKSQKRRDAAQTASNPLLKERPIFTPKKSKGTAGFRKCHDGRLPLDGFVLSTELDSFASMNLQDEKYKPPTVPEGWISKKQPSNDYSGKPYVSTADAAKLSSMDAKARAAILGEEQMPGKSVFDFLTPAARDRIATASGKSNLPAARNEKPPEGFETKEEDKMAALQDLVPKLDAEVALQALGRGTGGWMPYAEDEGKRARYRAFLEIRTGLRDGLPQRMTAMSKDDWVNELHEFARAAQVFKPVTGLMASRFTSSTSHPNLASDRPDSSADAEALLSQPPAKPEDPAVNAAKMGMFGPLTRTVKNFYPTRLLCKRFNVKPPAHVQLDPGNGPKEAAIAPTAANSRFQSTGYQMQAIGDVERAATRGADQMLLQSAGEVESSKNLTGAAHSYSVDPERNEALEAERPSDDVFKAIFGSDDEDD